MCDECLPEIFRSRSVSSWWWWGAWESRSVSVIWLQVYSGRQSRCASGEDAFDGRRCTFCPQMCFEPWISLLLNRCGVSQNKESEVLRTINDYLGQDGGQSDEIVVPELGGPFVKYKDEWLRRAGRKWRIWLLWSSWACVRRRLCTVLADFFTAKSCWRDGGSVCSFIPICTIVQSLRYVGF